MLSPGGRDAVGREDALRLLAELADVQGRLDDLKRRLRELVEKGYLARRGADRPY
jgi:hypothetical protein